MFLSSCSSTKIERPPMPSSGLHDDLAVLAQERVHVGHVAGDQGRRAALREPGRVDLLVHVAQALRAVDDQRALLLGALEDVGACRCTRCRTAGPCASAGSRARPARSTRGSPSVNQSLGSARTVSGAHAPEGDAVAQRQVALLEIAQARSRAPARRAASQRGVLGVLDVVDGVHHHAQSDVRCVIGSLRRARLCSVAARICLRRCRARHLAAARASKNVTCVA